MDIQLNLVNRSNDANNSDVVIFQKNVATNFDELAVAWQVIKYLGQGCNHPFIYPMAMEVSAQDAWGNYTPREEAVNGELWAMLRDTSGDVLKLVGNAPSSSEVQLRNDLPSGAITANIYKDDKLLATKTSVAPGQKAVFQFLPNIWIGVVSQVEQGQVMNSAIISDINTQISLLGIARADIVMTGGGPGPNSQPFAFQLENVVMA